MRRKPLIIGIALGLLAFAAVWGSAFFIPTERYQSLVVQMFKNITGHDVQISGNTRIVLLPRPALEVDALDLQTAVAGTRVPKLRIESLRAYLSYGSLFSDTVEVKAVALVRPSVQIERGADKVVQWDWLNAGTLARLAQPAAGQVSVPEIVVYDGQVSYVNPRVSYEEKVENINFSLTSGADGSQSLLGDMKLRGQTLQVDALMEAPTAGAPNQEAPFVLKLAGAQGDRMEINGKRSVLGGQTQWAGDMALSMQDLLAWAPKVPAPVATAAGPTPLSAVDNALVPVPQAPEAAPAQRATIAFPLKAEGKLTQIGARLALRETKLELADAKGVAGVEMSWENGANIKVVTELDKIQVLQWQALMEGWVFEVERAQAVRDAAAQAGSSRPIETRNPLADDIVLNMDVKAGSLNFPAGQVWNNIAMRAELADGAMTINQFDVTYAPESKLTVFGLVSHSGKGLRFEGNMESKGQDFRQFLALIDQEALKLPARGLGQFSATSNLFISGEQLRVSEAELNINELHLVGGLVTYFEAKPRIEAEIRLQDIDLDYFRDTWREGKMQERAQGFTLINPPRYDFAWLRELGVKVDFKVTIDGFNFLERQGQTASFRIFADTGEAGLYGVKMMYPDGSLDASVQLNVKGEQPYLDMIVTTGQFDTRYLAANPRLAELPAPPPPPPPPGTPPEQANNKWSEDLFDTAWATGWRGEFDLNIGELNHNGQRFDNFKLKAKLDKESLNIQKLSFGLWGGGFESAGTVVMGKVPALSMSFTFYNAEMREMIGSLSSLGSISGRASISGTATASGINMLSWVERASVKMVVAARGVWVRNFNLQGVIDSVNAARSVADVVNNVGRTITEGTTEFSVDGNLNVENGVMRTPGITLRSGAITGNMNGELRVIPWLIDAGVLFQFPSFSSETVPTLTVDLKGSADSPGLKTDTSSLEAYVAKRIVGR